MSDEKTKKSDKGANFDMYHFFSRKDVILAGLVILLLLLFALYKMMTGGGIA